MLRDDVWHGGLCEGAGNVRVHGGIFDSIAIETTGTLTYPPRYEPDKLHEGAQFRA